MQIGHKLSAAAAVAARVTQRTALDGSPQLCTFQLTVSECYIDLLRHCLSSVHALEPRILLHSTLTSITSCQSVYYIRGFDTP